MAGVEPSRAASSRKGTKPQEAARPSRREPASGIDAAWTVLDQDARGGEQPIAPIAGKLFCDVQALERADLGTIDALSRLALAAHRSGRELRLLNADSELCELVSFAGLSDVLACESPSRGGSGRSGEGGQPVDGDSGEREPLERS